jgi:hypothetical protein
MTSAEIEVRSTRLRAILILVILAAVCAGDLLSPAAVVAASVLGS